VIPSRPATAATVVPRIPRSLISSVAARMMSSAATVGGLPRRAADGFEGVVRIVSLHSSRDERTVPGET
jgi:hypothetical protein